MTAKEARAIAEEKLTAPMSSQYSEIKALIAAAAEKGQMYIDYIKTVNPAVKVKLSAEGYNVEPAEYDQRDRDYYGGKISW